MNGYLKDMGHFFAHGVKFFLHTTVFMIDFNFNSFGSSWGFNIIGN